MEQWTSITILITDEVRGSIVVHSREANEDGVQMRGRYVLKLTDELHLKVMLRDRSLGLFWYLPMATTFDLGPSFLDA